jgi:hypothetical protein
MWLAIRLSSHEIARTPIERPVEFGIGNARAVDDRLVVAGEEAGRFAELGDPHRSKAVLEELAGLLGVGGLRGGGTTAGVPEAVIDRPGVVRTLGGQERLAAGEEGRERRRVVVTRPAVEAGPADRLELAVGNVERIDALAGR